MSVVAVLFASAYDPGPGLTVAETLGIYVGIPLLVIALITLLVFATTGRRGPRYRPGMPWTGEPEWWAGPEQGLAAADAAAPTEGAGGARARF